jgi:uncharacterized protein YccT (UPF0319 family)
MFFIDYTRFKQTPEIDEIKEQIKVLQLRQNHLVSERNKDVNDCFDDELEKYNKRIEEHKSLKI